LPIPPWRRNQLVFREVDMPSARPISTQILIALVAVLAPLASSGPAPAHTASRGLHLHLSPDPAPPGATIRVRANAGGPMVRLRAGWAGQEPVEVRPENASREIVLAIRVPETVEGETLSLAAEAETESGETVRAAAILRIAEP
jgi:hypothetical protein